MKLSQVLLPLACLLALTVDSAAARQASTTGPRQPRTPEVRGELRLATNLPAAVTVGTEVRFTVTALDGEAPRLNVRLVNPPEGLVFTPARRAPEPWTGTGHWVVEPSSPALVELVFEVESVRGPRVVRADRFRVPVRVEGQRTPTGLVTGDVTADGVLDIVAASRSAVYVWEGSVTPSGTPTATLSFDGAVLGTSPEIELALVRDKHAAFPLAVVAVVPTADFKGVSGAGAIFVWEGPFTGTLPPDRVVGRKDPVTDDRLGSLGVHVFEATGLGGGLDIITGSATADVDGLVDCGLLVVLNDVTFVQELDIPGRAAGDALGDFTSIASVRIADVTGDGLPDIISGARFADPDGVANAGAAYVWHREPPFTGYETAATLRVPGGAQSNDRLGEGSELLVDDVTGDGIADVVVGGPRTDFTPAHNEGALYVFEGGTSLHGGTVSPKATLRDGLFHTTQDFLASGSSYFGTLPGAPSPGGPLLLDVSGDGVVDVVARSSFNQDRGMVFAWFGGAGIDGEMIQSASCLAPTSVDAEQLGEDGILTADVNGDSVLDIIVPVSNECVDGNLGAGAVHVWLGGTGFGGNSTPDATLRRTSPDPADALGEARSSVRLADVTNDGLTDVIVCAPAATVSGTTSLGAVFVFAGDVALSGEVLPTAVLSTPAGLAGEALGDISAASGFRSGLRVADLTGDGVLDVIAAASHATVGSSADAGHIQLWAGGPGLTGSPAPTALSVSTAAPADYLGLLAPAPAALDFAQGLRIGDVSGDGVLDLVVGAALAEGTVADAGAAYVWLGGAGLGGDPDETIANPSAAAGDQLARLRKGQGLQLADIDLDGILDVLLGTSFADPGGTVDAGAVLVRPSTGGLVEMAAPGAPAGDQLGY